jgi:hypothetical protein
MALSPAYPQGGIIKLKVLVPDWQEFSRKEIIDTAKAGMDALLLNPLILRLISQCWQLDDWVDDR